MNQPLEKTQREQKGLSLDDVPVFAFRTCHKALEARNGVALAQGTNETLLARLENSLKTLDENGAIVGALPFHYDTQPDSLWAADMVVSTPDKCPQVVDAVANWTVREDPPAAQYAKAVSVALEYLNDNQDDPEALTKIVLARSIQAQCDQTIDLQNLFERLASDPSVNVFQVALPPRDQSARYMIGATPELLVSKTGGRISSHPLAGSAQRQGNLADDSAVASQLSRSRKDRHEHAIVVEYILDVLAPWCKSLKRPDGMTLSSTRNMWHLGTWIEGVLRDPDVPVPVLAAALHPTPAVCGWPKKRAGDTITGLEPFKRDFFTGAVGWCEANGDGEWYITLRCAEITDKTARLYAGAGIVPGSDPWSEVAETGAKMGAMMGALNISNDISKFRDVK